MFAVIVNTLAIILGTTVGLLLRRGIPRHISEAIMKALGLCTVIIGIQGAVAEERILLMIVACVLGVLIGEWLDWEGHVNRFTERITSRFAGQGEGAKMANAFVTSCLIMNVGAGLSADYTLLYTKSLLDLVSGTIMGAAMGVGVMGSAIFTLLFQGGIVLFAEWLAPFISLELIKETACTGSLLIVAIGFNMLELTKFKVINYLPALVMVPVLLWLDSLWGCL